MAKAPSTVIKAINQGCKVQLIIGINAAKKNHYVIALKIYDTDDNPLLTPTTPRTEIEIHGIANLANKLDFTFVMYNEVNVPSIHGQGSLRRVKNTTPKTYDPSVISTVESMEEANEVIDSFCYSIDSAYGTKKFHESFIECFNVEFNNMKVIPFISTNEYGSVYHQIDAKDEGLSQEEELSHFLENLHEDRVFHSPQVKFEKKKRELIDVLACDSRCNYLIESKALCLNDSGYEITNSRKVATLIKGARKALKQLQGAIKAIRRNETITTKSGSPLLLENHQNIHGIVVISEWLASEQWSDIINEIEKNSGDGVFLHVIDFAEFINTIKLSSSPTVSFEQCLIERYSAVIENKTLNIRGIDSSLPMFAKE